MNRHVPLNPAPPPLREPLPRRPTITTAAAAPEKRPFHLGSGFHLDRYSRIIDLLRAHNMAGLRFEV